MASPAQKIGLWGEKIAQEYLKKKGYHIIENHYQVREGEIDIIAQKNEELIFFEVKTRTNQKFGLPFESLNESKQKKLRQTIQKYFAENPDFENNFRVDCLSIEISRFKKKIKIHHLKNIL